MTDAVVLAPLAVTVALVVAGGLKVCDPGAVADAAADLGVPARLTRSALMSALPAGEIVLGLAVVLTPGGYAVVPAALALLLLLAYTVLVVRAVLAGTSAECGCFGDHEPVGPHTVVRNLVLLTAAVVAVVAALDRSPVSRLADLDGAGWWWLAGAVVLALVVAVTLPRPGERPLAEARGIPYLPVTRADGSTTTLPELASLRAQLLVSLSAGCSRCTELTETIDRWPTLLPQLDVHALTAEPPGTPVPDAWPDVLHDPEGRVATVLGLGRPSAVLLGADAMIAGGPVHGPKAVLALVEEIRAQLGDT